MHGSRGAQGMSGGGLMMMMGNDPVAAYSSMMMNVSANPKRHREMNAMMTSQMKSSDGSRSR